MSRVGHPDDGRVRVRWLTGPAGACDLGGYEPVAGVR
jgi:hypothetical protein